MYKLCVFDMDGTVVNSIGDIAAAMNRSLVKMGKRTYEDADYRQMVGDGMEVLCRRALPGAAEEEVQELIALYGADYLAHCCERSAPYNGIPELLEELKSRGAICAVLSNKPHNQALSVAEQLFKKDAFDTVLGFTEKFPPKPSPESLLYLIDKFGAELSDTVYIGDSNVDIRLGKAAKVFTVGVTWGFRGAAELLAEGADKIADTPRELAEIIL